MEKASHGPVAIALHKDTTASALQASQTSSVSHAGATCCYPCRITDQSCRVRSSDYTNCLRSSLHAAADSCTMQNAMPVIVEKSYSCVCCRKQAASDFYKDKLLSQSLQQWQQCARWSRDSGWKEDLAFGHRAETLVLKCMEGWHLVRECCHVYCTPAVILQDAAAA